MSESGRRIAFAGSRGFADFYGVGGMQSYIRRLGLELARRGHRVDYLVHAAHQEQDIRPVPGIRVRYFSAVADGLAELSTGGYSDVIRVWMARWDRLEFVRHVLGREAASRRNHYVWFVLPDPPGKRLLGMFEGLATSRGGRLFCVSARQWRAAKRWTRKASLLLPPVPEAFFLRPSEKPLAWPLRVTFLGVLHPDKGIKEVVELFGVLRDDPRFDCSIYATHDPRASVEAALHAWLFHHKNIRYVPMEQRKWSVELEQEVQAVLAQTDVFVQPLQSLQNTVDTPLLVLEAMASLCAVLTTPLGSIPEVYGESPFLISPSGLVGRAATLLKGLNETALLAERTRIHGRNQALGFSQAAVVDALLAAIEEVRVVER